MFRGVLTIVVCLAATSPAIVQSGGHIGVNTSAGQWFIGVCELYVTEPGVYELFVVHREGPRTTASAWKWVYDLNAGGVSPGTNTVTFTPADTFLVDGNADASCPF